MFVFDPDCNFIEISNCAPRVGEVRCDIASSLHNVPTSSTSSTASTGNDEQSLPEPYERMSLDCSSLGSDILEDEESDSHRLTTFAYHSSW